MATTECYTYLHTISLHVALPIFHQLPHRGVRRAGGFPGGRASAAGLIKRGRRASGLRSRARPHGGFRAVGWVGVINPAFACGSGEGWVDQANPAYVNFSWERLQPRVLRSEAGVAKVAAEAKTEGPRVGEEWGRQGRN